MSDEFKFRALPDGEWVQPDSWFLVYEGSLRLKTQEKAGTYISRPLDSGISGCIWHRIVLDSEIPENSALKVSFYTSESEDLEENWSEPLIFKKAKDALLQAEPGRYIRLKIDFLCEGEESPVLRGIKVYYPGTSYLRYLPAIYQEDADSRDFMGLFLSLFESELYDSEEKISRISSYFDPMAAPKDFVPWLASWLSLDLYDILEEDKKREFILRAVEFYKMKGTVEGLASLVSFLTGLKCCVKEYMNNVFRTWGMEHDETDEIINPGGDVINGGCTTFYSETSKTWDESLPKNIGKYRDRLHYVIDTGENGRYAPNFIGLFIFIEKDKKLLVEKDQLPKIINSFLPVFVRVEISVQDLYREICDIGKIDDKYEISITHEFLEKVMGVTGSYNDSTSWKCLCTYGPEHNTHGPKHWTCGPGFECGKTNDLECRTLHTGLRVEHPI
ncbi:MAG: phage tail protein [Methanosarcinaceae archaeon]